MNVFGLVVLASVITSFIITRYMLVRLTNDEVYSVIMAMLSSLGTLSLLIIIKSILE